MDASRSTLSTLSDNAAQLRPHNWHDDESQADIIRAAESRFRKACEQIVVINRQLDDLGIRYDLANKAGRRSFRYTLRLRIAIAEGVRNMYYEYATQKADEISELRRHQIISLGHIDSYIENEEFSDDSDAVEDDSDGDDDLFVDSNIENATNDENDGSSMMIDV